MLRAFEYIKENFGMMATIIGFIVDSVALIALAEIHIATDTPISVFPLSTSTQFLIWILALLSYLGFLRDYWRKARCSREDDPLDESFFRFLFYDLPRLKNPYALIGFAVLIVLLGKIVLGIPDIEVQIFATIGFILSLIVVVSIPIYLKSEEEAEELNDWEWEYIYQDDIFNKWVHRIMKELSNRGFVTDHDLSRIYSESISLCNKALRRYLDAFEFKDDLALLTESHIITNQNNLPETVYFYILVFRDNISKKGWTENINSVLQDVKNKSMS